MYMHGSAQAAGSGKPAPRAHPLRMQSAVNRIVRVVLRTPLVCRAAGRRLVVIYVTGRKSGRQLTIPVAYTRHDGALLVGTPFPWVRNLRSGDAVMILLQGRRRLADVQLFSDQESVVDLYGSMARDNHAFAKFNTIRLGEAGEPNPEDLRLAWAAGARVVRLTPR